MAAMKKKPMGKNHEKTESKKEMVKEYGKKAAAKKAAARKGKGDGMMTTKEVSKIYNKAKNKKGKFDPTKIPGFDYGKGTR